MRFPASARELLHGRAARNASSPTLARRFPVGAGDTPLPAGTSTARTGNLHSRTTSFPRLAPEYQAAAKRPVRESGPVEGVWGRREAPVRESGPVEGDWGNREV